ncbi:hypothetical protein L1987_32421 [Smallanthus sonchifolius]|uniref:Uncharacterized protein n=1 Tax=Smallanthus sonchifolius TaxID=185202 RepID=A0ACB9HMJ6_9ASTR|nr:hypothetical protein L1987_32421 [Smallanthus sonchifolius]
MLTNLKKQRRTLTLCVICRDKKLKSTSVAGISAKGLVPYDEEKAIRIRNSPITLCKLVKLLTDKQKMVVKEMGFGSIIMFNISSLPTSLGYWLVSNYDPSCNQLNLGTHVITITSQTVHEVLGIPMGKVQFGKLKNPTMKDVVIAEFRNQFDIADKLPTPKNLFDHLKERYKRTNPGKKQIPAISFFGNDTINKLSADDEEKEKEKEVETETVKGDRKRKRGDKEEKEQEKEKEKEVETKTVKGDRKRRRGDKEEKEQDPSAIISEKPSKKAETEVKKSGN